mgnify:CR=1 FL=1
MNESSVNNDAWERGRDLYEDGHHWHAHEAWEELWLRTADLNEANLLRAVIQVAAAMVKAEQGNMIGVQKNLSKARANLLKVPQRCLTIEVSSLILACDRCVLHAQSTKSSGNLFDWKFKPIITLISKKQPLKQKPIYRNKH